ncbi:MAG: STAS-like domain-containing protein [Aggregatilineales bacterium]
MNRILLAEQIGKYCVTAEDGQRIYEQIHPLLSAQQHVQLDFAGVQIVASPFLNMAVGQLLRDLDPATLNTYLKFENLLSGFKPILRRVIENAKRYYADPAYRAAVESVLAKREEDFDAD